MNRDVEPWLRGTLPEIEPMQRAVLHALELTAEDATQWAFPLAVAELNESPFGLPSIAFHLRHIARSLDRLLTYAEGRQLRDDQFHALRSEADPVANRGELEQEFGASLSRSSQRVRAFTTADLPHEAYVGRDRLRTTVAGLLVHCADHTQRHSGQMVTTAKLLRALRGSGAQTAKALSN